MMKRVVLSALMALLLATVAPGGAVMRALSTAELTKSSDVIVEGDVESVTSHWAADGKTIVSSATIRVLDIVRGVADQPMVSVEYEGGEVGDVGMGVSDMATLASGQRILLFMRKKSASGNDSRYELIGRAQGLYKIGADRIARKGGFSVLPGSADALDNELDVDLLKEKIRGVR